MNVTTGACRVPGLVLVNCQALSTMKTPDSPQFQFIAPLAGGQRPPLLLPTPGGTLEYYDFVIYVFFATAIGQLFFPKSIPDWLSQVQTFGIFAAAYIARPLCGMIMAHVDDLVDRKRMFMLSVLLMSLPTLLMGLSPTYETVGVKRSP
jgi:MFS family permease